MRHARRGRHSTTGRGFAACWATPSLALVAMAGTLIVAMVIAPNLMADNTTEPPPDMTSWTTIGRPAGLLNLALGRPTTSSDTCTSAETAAKAVNGSLGDGPTDKWCSTAPNSVLRVDLGARTELGSLTVRHAQAGGERAAYNTRDFDVQTSDDGSRFRTIARVRGNTKAVTTHAVGDGARFVQLTVLSGQQTGRGPARVYELEAYGPATTTARPSARPARPPTPRPGTSSPPQPVRTVCFPFPALDPARRPPPTVTVAADVPATDRRYLDETIRLLQEQWPRAWQVFAPKASLNDPLAGIKEVILTNDPIAWIGNGTVTLPYIAVALASQRGDLGAWLHDSARLLQAGYPASAPGLFTEGIADFVRFTARGEDPRWKLVAVGDVGPRAFDEKLVWSTGHREGARFLLWLTQRYDRSGARYRLVHDLNAAANTGDRDFPGMFVRLTGKTYSKLFAEYTKDRAIHPHC